MDLQQASFIPSSVTRWWSGHPEYAALISAGAVVAGALLSFPIVRRLLVYVLNHLSTRTTTAVDDSLVRRKVPHRAAYLAPFLIIHGFAPVFGHAQEFMARVSLGAMAWFVVWTLVAAVGAGNDVYQTKAISTGRPIKGYVQVAQLFLYVIGLVLVVSLLAGRSPWALVSGIGAMTAVILLIFRDTILGLVASLQITTNDMVRVGDWIEVPAFGADGDVVDIALHTVRVRNWDKTYSFIPTHRLVEAGFRNWRGMQEAGGRRIKRALWIDCSSIRFADDHLLDRFSSMALISDYVRERSEEIAEHNKALGTDPDQPANGRHMTNIGTFREYVRRYLEAGEKIHEDMTFMVRQLPPSPQGLGLEIYAFARNIEWTAYEQIQADIFDHLLAVCKEFDLRVFQGPTGDLSGLSPGRPPHA